jgi:hypothetical protein
MKYSYTPGPWQTARFNPDRATVEIETVARGDELPDQGGFIALVGAYGKENEWPDARLIAAAPDLLAALEFALATLDHRDGLRHRMDLFTGSERDTLRAAIAKARGEC